VRFHSKKLKTESMIYTIHRNTVLFVGKSGLTVQQYFVRFTNGGRAVLERALSSNEGEHIKTTIEDARNCDCQFCIAIKPTIGLFDGLARV
jgi:hypothetical protein